MDRKDFNQFTSVLDTCSQVYDKKNPLQTGVIELYFTILSDHSIEQVKAAITAHMKGGTGSFMPKPADIIKQIEGGDITADQVVAAAKIADTPFGILARIHIGAWDLNNMNSFDLRQQAEEVLMLLPRWKIVAKEGGYTDHQISIMLKHGVDPHQPFFMGIADTTKADALTNRIEYVQSTSRHQELLAPPFQSSECVTVPINEILARLEDKS